MSEMKDSGIEWIGDAPQNWQLVRIKVCVSRRDSGAWGEEATGEPGDCVCIRVADMDYDRIRLKDDLPFTYRNYEEKVIESLKLADGDILIEKSGGGEKTLVGRAVMFRGTLQAVFANFMERIRCRDFVRSRFLLYILAVLYQSGYIKNYIKQTTGIQNLDISSMFSKEYLALPPVVVQDRITDFLDRKCSQIDAIIARQQEVIEKLKAYKLSVITEAVIKGLNPNVSMKDSGVEWIGEVPEHWDFRRIKNCCLIVDCKNRTPDPDPDGEYIVVRTTCIRDGSFSYEGSYHTNAENFKEWTAKGQPQYGDIFFTREAPMGEACLVPDADNLCMGQRVMFFRPLDGSDPRYILYSIYGPLTREYIDSKNKGSTVGHLKLGQVASLPLFYCPPKEQSEIADYLDKRCGAIDKVVEKKAEIIARLTDYKKSLIYEVVTGKKEV